MYVLKLCTKCNEEKLLEEFRRHDSSIFGRYDYCRKCMSNYFKLHKEKNKDSYKNRWAIDSAKICHKLKTDSKYRSKKENTLRHTKRIGFLLI